MSSHGLQRLDDCLTDDSLDALADDWNSDVVRVAVYVQEGHFGCGQRYPDLMAEELSAAGKDRAAVVGIPRTSGGRTVARLYAVFVWLVASSPFSYMHYFEEPPDNPEEMVNLGLVLMSYVPPVFVSGIAIGLGYAGQDRNGYAYVLAVFLFLVMALPHTVVYLRNRFVP